MKKFLLSTLAMLAVSLFAHADVYKLVTDASTLAVGDKLVITNTAGTKAMGALNSTYMKAVDVTITDGEIVNPGSEIVVVELEDAGSGNFYLKTADGYLATPTSKNSLRVLSTVNAAACAVNITISNKVATVNYPNTTVEWNSLKYNPSSPRFACYSTGQQGVGLYKLDASAAQKDQCGIEYSASTFEYTIGGQNEAFPTLTTATDYDGTVTFTSSEESVATVDATGAVTVVAAGSTTIKATASETDNYYGGEASYILTVVDPNATNATWVAADQGYENDKVVTSFTVGKVTFELSKGSNTNNAPKYYTNGSNIRVYKDNEITVTPEDGYLVTKIVFTADNGYPLANTAEIPGTVDGSTWTDAAGATTFTFHHNNNDATTQFRFTKVYVEWIKKSADYVAAPEFSPAGGTFFEAQSVTLTAAEGTTIYYTLDNSEPSTASTEYTAPITISTTTTVKAIAAKGSAVSGVASATYTIEEPAANIAAFKQTTGNAALRLTNAAVIGVVPGNNTKIYIQDATGGIALYGKNMPDYTIGQVLNGVLYGKYSPYNNLPELTDGDYTGITATEGAAPAPKVINIDQVTEADYCTLVTIDNAHCDALANNAVISQTGNTATITLRNECMGGAAFPEYQNFDVTGVLNVFNTTVQISPRSAADFTETANDEKVTVINVKDEVNVKVGATVALNATVNSGATLTYASSDETVATVSAEGVVTGVAEGTATITITAPEYDGYPSATKEVTVKVTEAPQVIYVTLVAKDKDEDGKYWAMSSETGSVNNSLAAVEVTVDSEGYVELSEDNTAIYWNIDEENGYIMSYDGKYLNASSGKTDLSVSDNATEWTWNATNKAWTLGTRSFLYSTDGYFKNFAYSNVGKKGYAVTFTNVTPYKIVSTGIDAVGADNVAAPVYYNLQGVRVAAPAAGNVYIKVVGNKASKVLVK